MKRILRRTIRALDRFLTRRMDPIELWDDPEALFHGRLLDSPRPLDLEDRTVPSGVPVLELHLRNEHLPEVPAEGTDLAWAAQGRRRLLATLRAVAERLETDPRFTSVQAVGGTTALSRNELFRRMGFTVRRYESSLGRFGVFWENVYSWMLLWAYNPRSLRHRRWRDLERYEAWISREGFLRRFRNDRRSAS